ncbi:hypothetical protein GOP47_0025326 [Adiantum capillus-veneris]|uniref:Uncharacterized protein n=1 Tax=Adiantum capillus-veneris TaxID=13818 RepID=A0A9D4U0T7_ADICA|nr:hypothetical protein GOP47_0025326 [Adiantum capillus-veneris]
MPKEDKRGRPSSEVEGGAAKAGKWKGTSFRLHNMDKFVLLFVAYLSSVSRRRAYRGPNRRVTR